MGTNYYVKAEDKPACPTCGHKDEVEPLHIGKSSAGWKFLFAPYPEHDLTSWEAWRSYLSDKQIVDEYGRDVPLDELVRWVESKQRDGLTGFTASRMQWGGSNPHEHERLDDHGYRFSTTADFS